ncbi:NACHT, LRR and PYD domains-containing protein 12-like isoform X2 [Sardina pilchardus]|uniref:NACHT, LRR and PYD domains-containing protein 12-like isoform X2 n=1 Tax=Sardina pilchardus TaxID=27697 RepID=UPI002E0F74E5
MDQHAPPSENRWTPEEAEIHEKLKSTLKSKFEQLVEGVPNQGGPRLLQEIYTDLYVTEGGGGGGVSDEHEVRRIERAFWREPEDDRPIKCSDIFQPSPGPLKPVRTVLTKGVAGIGKTLSVQKFILDWAEGTAYQEVHFIFPLPFRELNLMKEKKLSLMELIQLFFPEVKIPRIFSSSEHRIVFIFDGLDECRLPLDFRSNPRCCDATEPVSVDVLLTNLIKGDLLPSALLWITTRPAAANQIPPEFVNQVTEIWGFNDPQKDEYFRKRISDENLASRTVTHLKSTRSLYIMCHIPVFCWITATVVERTSESERVKMPRTLTQMYTHFLIVQTSIKQKYTERKEADEEVIFQLGKLAFQQLEKGNLIFYEEDLRECGIDVTEASVYSGVCTQIFREEAGLCHGRVFSFVHLSIQEFLAALYVFLCFSNRQRNIPDQQQTSQLSALFTATTLHDLHKTAVDLALQSKKGHLDLFLRFLLGLSLESNQSLLLKHLLPQTSQPQSLENTVQYIKQKIRDQDFLHRSINLFCCLNELNHHAVVELIDRSSGTLHIDMLSPVHWGTQRFTFKMSEEQLDEFDLQKHIKTPEEDQTELLSPEEALQKLLPVVTTSTSAVLYCCSLTEKSCAALSGASSTCCSLRELDLSGNSVHDAGVQHLTHFLKNPHCKLETLMLEGCSLTEESCSYLASAISSPCCSLRELHLIGNELHDAGVQHLTHSLHNPHCKLEKLVLGWCSLTEKSCAALSGASSTCCSLRELDLSGNSVHDAGVQHLTHFLKNPHCKLETLMLSGCSLTEKSCAALSGASSTCCSLRELDLSENSVHDAGVQHLTHFLKNPHCKLEKLTLERCSLTEKSCAALSGVCSTPCCLKELNLSRNKLHDEGAQHLTTLLNKPHCRLEKLVY